MLSDVYQHIVENISDGVRVLDENGIIIYANEALCSLFGYDKSELIGKSVYELYPPDARQWIERHLSDLKSGKKLHYETPCLNKSPHESFVEVSSVPMFNDSGKYQGCYTVIRDISEKKVFEKKLIEEKNFFNDLISLCPDSIMGIDRSGVITTFNQAAERLTGYSSKDITGKMNIVQIYDSPESARIVKKKLHSSEFGSPGQLQGFETQIVDRTGHKIPIRLSAILIYKNNEEIGSVGYFHDLTRTKQMEAKLRELSITDSLSGLYNQRHFYTVLAQEMDRNTRYRGALSLVCFDIDNFKQCNDKLGHLEGDNIIRMVGEVLHEKLRRSDYAFRYGGDEFMIILPETPLENARFSAERVRKEFNARWSFGAVCDTSCLKQVTLSMGIAEANIGESSGTFIKRADLAMYEAKRAGGNQTVKARTKIGDGVKC